MVSAILQLVLYLLSLTLIWDDKQQLGFALLILGVFAFLVMERVDTNAQLDDAQTDLRRFEGTIKALAAELATVRETLADNRALLRELLDRSTSFSRDEAIERCIANMREASLMWNIEYYVSDAPTSVEHVDRWRTQLAEAVVGGNGLCVMEIGTDRVRLQGIWDALGAVAARQTAPPRGRYRCLHVPRTASEFPLVEFTLFEFARQQRPAEMFWAWVVPNNELRGVEWGGPRFFTKDPRLIEYFKNYFECLLLTLRRRAEEQKDGGECYGLDGCSVVPERPAPPGTA